MEDKLLQKLANIAVARQHINYIVNGGTDRKNINPMQKMGKELDEQFVKLLLEAPVVVNSMNVESTTFEDIIPAKPPSDVRPKVKTSKKTVK